MSAGASIYDNLIHTPKPESPVEMATKAADLRIAMGRAQLVPAEVEKAQEEAAQLHQRTQTATEDSNDQKTLQGIYGEVHADDSVPIDQKDAELRKRAAGKVKPRTLEALSKSMEEHQKSLAALHDDELKNAKAVSDEIGNTAQGILTADPAKQPALWASERQRLINQKVATPEEIPEQFNPEFLKMAAAHAMGASNAVQNEQKRREQDVKDSEDKRKARTDELATMGQTIDGAQDQAGYDAWRAKLSPENRALTAATYSPQNVATIKRMALTANQQREADQATATESETKRHNQALEDAASNKPTYSGEMRAALVAAGAKDPDNPSKEESAAAFKVLHPGTEQKPPSAATLTAIEQRKSKAIRDSKAKLDKELATNTVGGKVVDQDAIEQAWQDHIGRLQDAQGAYESELTTATGNDVGHNDWADRLQVPGKPGAAPAQPAAGAPGGKGASAQAPAPAAAAAPKAKTATNEKGEKVMWNGKAWVPYQPAQP